MPGAGPHQTLVSPGQDLDRLDVWAVAGDREVVVPVGADQVGQYFGVAGIRFRAGDLVALAVAGDRERVDREHLVPGCYQCLDP